MTDPGRRLRWGLALLAAAHLVILGFLLATGRVEALEGTTGPGDPSYSGWPAAVVMTLGLLAVWRFATEPRAAWPGWATLAALVVMGQLFGLVRGSPGRNFNYSALLLLGWLIGRAVARRMGLKSDDPRAAELADTGAVAAFSAIYVSSGLMKLTTGGAEWLDGTLMRLVTLAHHAPEDPSWMGQYADLVARGGPFVDAITVGVVIIETGAFVMLLSRPARRLWAGLIAAMHLNILLLLDIFYWEALYLGALLAITSAPTRPTAIPKKDAASGLIALACGAALAVLIAVALPGMDARQIHTESAPQTSDVTRFGPLTIGMELSDGSRVDALSLTENALTVGVAQGGLRAEALVTIKDIGELERALTSQLGEAMPSAASALTAVFAALERSPDQGATWLRWVAEAR